jgi:hypothetical protein
VVQFGQGLCQPFQVQVVRKDREVGVAAKLGRAVEHARLAAHEECADPLLRIEERTLRIGFGIK